MSILWRVVALAALAVVVLVPGSATAQKDDREKVRIVTADGVELSAHFYRCTNQKIKSPPTILMLHPIGAGENSSKKSWVALAETLQKNAAVLTFDFRGHGQSTEVDPDVFWKIGVNKSTQFIKGALQAASTAKQTIDFKELEKAYYPALVNDIAACKSYLDRKNDVGEGSGCNTSSFILVGAESGATLGAIWLYSEWHRHRLVQNPVNLALIPENRAAGQDVIACVWLSITSQLGARDQTGVRAVTLGTLLKIPMVDRAVPMAFVHGETDEKAKAVTNGLLKFRGPKDKKKYAWTDKVVVPGTDLKGADLLQKSTGVDRAIASYLFGDASKDAEGVVDAKGREFTAHERDRTQYMWRSPGGPLSIPPGQMANGLKEKNLVFSMYEKYAK